MSRRPGTKSIKRAPSTKKKGDTPDSSTPTASGVSIGIEKPPPDNSIDEVLLGEEIEALRIQEEQLGKVRQNVELLGSPPTAQKKRSVLVRKQQVAGTGNTAHKQKEYAVLRPLPPTATVSSTRTLGSVVGGPRFDQQGAFLSHSILGSATEFATELKNSKMVDSTSAFRRSKQVRLPFDESKAHQEAMSYEKTIKPRESNSLQHWNHSMTERKAHAQHLAEKIGSKPEKLLMNQGDGFRAVQEERILIDRAMPSVDYGKGYRVGSEFWSQAVHIGNRNTGIHTTLTCTEQGVQPELEFVGLPSTVAKERGASRERNAPAHYTWQQSQYLSTRRDQLPGSLLRLHRPEVSQLQVIGNAGEDGDCPMRSDSLDSLGEALSSDDEHSSHTMSVMDLQCDAAAQPIIGPALLVNGQLVKWEGLPTQSSTEQEGPAVSPQSSRNIPILVNIESTTGDSETSCVEIENVGTAAVYFSWQYLPKPNPLGTFQAGDTQRFYFDTKGGVLLPGRKTEFPFVFKSSSAGIFSETWLFETGPVLCQGRPIVFTLKGIAFQEDLNKPLRDELEAMLNHRIAVAAAERLVNQAVDSVRSTINLTQGIPPIQLEEDTFKTQNPELFYNYDVVEQLKRLYDSILRPERLEQLQQDPSTRSDKGGKKDDKSGQKGKEKSGGKDKIRAKTKDEPNKENLSVEEEEQAPQVPDWDLSVPSLQEIILAIEDRVVVESKLKEFSDIVGSLSYPPPKQVKNDKHKMVYEALLQATDLMSAASVSLCHTMGLPVKEFSHKDESLGDKLEADTQLDSPAHSKDKKGGKDAKKGKQGKDALKSGSSKGKTLTQKKASKSSLSPKEAEGIKQVVSELNITVDPVMKNKYTDNFYSMVYEILGRAADQIELILEH